MIGFLAPHLVLSEGIGTVRERNFEFLDEWKAVQVPQRFILDNYTPRKRDNVQPIMSRLEGEGLATRRELDEYYSLKDVFDMFDASCLRSVNAAWHRSVRSMKRS
ncbi:hypothetical protein [Paraburkholderia sp. J76]|uniref:hypothetical protein n=1 Tax=Paraburkholderia sp. J76 TaxID=2805439 RepID=UPI002ABE8589|nr:hypothetical protein [Paraburkholderia sp. J76]